MEKKYLELDLTKAEFYEYSKEVKESFEKHTSSGGKVSYRKYYDKGVIGKLEFINEREDDFGKGVVKSLQLVMKDVNGDRVYLKVGILTSNGSLNEFFESIAPVLPNLKSGEAYRIYPYAMDTEYTNKAGEVKPTVNKGISVSTYDIENDTKLLKVERAYQFGGGEGQIPNISWTKEVKMGVTKNTKDDTERLNFLYDVFTKCLSSKPEDKKEEKKEQSPVPPSAGVSFPGDEDDEHDDLPF